jgi:hypothetical protein
VMRGSPVFIAVMPHAFYYTARSLA